MTDVPTTQYATDRNLAARQHLWASGREPAFDMFGWTLDLGGVGQAGDDRILDVGCGNGNYEKALAARGHRGQVVPMDMSAGMLTTVPSTQRVQADAQALPFRPRSFDLVLAPHMLYHVPDIGLAATELRRVLRDGARCVAVTNGQGNLREVRDLIESSIGNAWTMQRSSDRFSLENGADQLAVAFDDIVRVDCPPGHVVVRDAEALAGYVASIGDLFESQVTKPWTEVVEDLRSEAAHRIGRDGEMRLSTSVGAFVCR
ncbi:MAG TPA: class I SAM-dependent methyltransferase [Acidimicrobiales bacterium]|nr:class I SAM-dependent methyltransferase [Acidimicrobiales bacterium]